MNLFELTRKLIDIPSPTGDERAVGEFLCSHLGALGYQVEAQEVEGARANVIATLPGSPARVVLSTHMDTVPPFIPSGEDEEFVHGRGACDAKGIMAAQITACERLRAEGVNEIGMLFTVDEEMGSLGARAADEHPLASECRFLVNGEPTDNRLAVGSKGSLRLTIKAEGRAAHSAYPEQGDSAIEKLLDVLADVRACAWPSDERFGETTCNVGVIRGGTRPNVVAAEAEADLQIRLVTPAEEVKEILERAVGGRARVEYLSAHDPAHMVAVEGFGQTVVRFTTDIPYLTRWGAPLLIGPGSILSAHTDAERVSKRELTDAVGLYARLVGALLARARDEDDESIAGGDESSAGGDGRGEGVGRR